METPLSILLREKEQGRGKQTHTITPQATIYECSVKLHEFGIGALLVIENDQLRGIISERDIIYRLVSCKCDPMTTKVSEIMSSDLVTVPPTMKVHEAMRLVTDRRFRHLPVVENGKLLGLISIGDLTRWVMLAQEREISSLTDYISGGR